MFRQLSFALLTTAMSLAGPCFATAQNPVTPDLGNWRGPCYNCYNYALNRKDWFFAQTLGVVPPAKITCANATAAAMVDGLNVAAWAGPPLRNPRAGQPGRVHPVTHSLRSQ